VGQRREPSWKQKDIFPPIQEAIERVCKRKGEALHEEIVDELLKDPEACSVIDRAVQQRSDGDRRSMAANMIAWLSQKHTTRPGNLGEFSRRFDKRKQGHKAYAYRPAK